MALGRSRSEVAIFDHRKKLPGMHATAAIHVELLYRGDNLGRNCRLVPGIKYGLAADDLLDRLLLRLSSLYRNFRPDFGFFLRAGRKRQKRDCKKQE